MYSWPLNNVGVTGSDPQSSWKFAQNLTVSPQYLWFHIRWFNQLQILCIQSAYKWARTIQTYVVQGFTVISRVIKIERGTQKRESERSLGEKDSVQCRWLWRWRNGITIQGMQVVSRNRKRQGNRFSPGPPGRNTPCWLFDLSPVGPVSDFRPSEL